MTFSRWRRGRRSAAMVVVMVLTATSLLAVPAGSAEPTDDANALASDPARAAIEIEPITCDSILTTRHVEIALAVFARQRAGLSGSTIAFHGNDWMKQLDRRLEETPERCQHLIYEDRTHFVRMDPATLADESDGARERGRNVPGIGDQAILVHATAEEGQSSLTIEEMRDVGRLGVRLTLSRPDLKPSERGRILALLAIDMLPRFPGQRSGPGEAPVITDQAEPSLDLVGNLLAKEAAGEWTRGEGLVRTLAVLIGEGGAVRSLGDVDELEFEGSGILAMAARYLASPSETEHRSDIERLLDRLVITTDELERMVEPTSESTASAFVTVATDALPGARDDCVEFFEGYQQPLPEGVDTPCVQQQDIDVKEGDAGPGRFRMFLPHPDFPQGGWTKRHFDEVRTAYGTIVERFERIGSLPNINLVFSVQQGPPTNGQVFSESGMECAIVLYPKAQRRSIGFMRHLLAHEMAHCLQVETFRPQERPRFESIYWRQEGLAEYLANFAFPHGNYEWEFAPKLPQFLNGGTPFDVKPPYTNFLFFQHAANELEIGGLFDMIRALPVDPASTAEDQITALAKFDGIEQLYQSYAEGLLDGTIEDEGGGTNNPLVRSVPPSIIGGAFSDTLELQPFTIATRRWEVEGCDIAPLRTPTGNGAAFELKARPFAKVDWRGLPARLAGRDAELRERVVVATSTKEVQIAVGADRVVDDPACVPDPAPDGDSPDPADLPCAVCGPSHYYNK